MVLAWVAMVVRWLLVFVPSWIQDLLALTFNCDDFTH